jgi:hypothetical protein
MPQPPQPEHDSEDECQHGLVEVRISFPRQGLRLEYAAPAQLRAAGAGSVAIEWLGLDETEHLDRIRWGRPVNR